MIKTLPHLPLDAQTSHLTQEMADQIIDYLVEHYPERMEKIARDEKGYTDALTIMAYAEAIQTVIAEMGKTMDTPDSELGYIALNFELVRRCRAAFGYEIPKVLGKPLAPSISGPYPEKLVEKPILYQSVFRAGFTQEQIDVWVDEFYKNNKQLCYEKAEADRRSVSSFYLKRNPITSYFRKKAEETGDSALIRSYSTVASELSARIALTCEVITLEYLNAVADTQNAAEEKLRADVASKK